MILVMVDLLKVILRLVVAEEVLVEPELMVQKHLTQLVQLAEEMVDQELMFLQLFQEHLIQEYMLAVEEVLPQQELQEHRLRVALVELELVFQMLLELQDKIVVPFIIFLVEEVVELLVLVLPQQEDWVVVEQEMLQEELQQRELKTLVVEDIQMVGKQ